MPHARALWPRLLILFVCLLIGRSLSASEAARAPVGGLMYAEIERQPEAARRIEVVPVTPAEIAGMCDQAGAFAARAEGVPPKVLQAITLTETGRSLDGAHRAWPWTVNMEGVGKWFATREEALAYVMVHYERGARSFDVGCFQINYRWHGNAFRSIEEMFDPRVNALYAAGFLRRLYGETGSWSKSAGAYHSRTPEFAKRYAKRFDRILAGLGGKAAPPPVTGEYVHNMEVVGDLPEIRHVADASERPRAEPLPATPGSLASGGLFVQVAPLLTQPRKGLY